MVTNTDENCIWGQSDVNRYYVVLPYVGLVDTNNLATEWHDSDIVAQNDDSGLGNVFHITVTIHFLQWGIYIYFRWWVYNDSSKDSQSNFFKIQGLYSV